MENQTEIWKDVVGYEGLYQVSNFGGIKSLDKKVRARDNSFRIIKSIKLKSSLSKLGYVKFNLYKNLKRKTFLLHRLVSIAFLPNPENKKTVNHKNGIKTDNRVENLEWCTIKENSIHSFSTGLNKGPQGEKQWMSILTKEQVLLIRKSSLKHRVIAEMYNTSVSTISAIKTRRNWKHI